MAQLSSAKQADILLGFHYGGPVPCFIEDSLLPGRLTEESPLFEGLHSLKVKNPKNEEYLEVALL